VDTPVVGAVAEGEREPIADGRVLLEAALERAGCWDHVADVVAQSGKGLDDIRVFVLPDMEFYDAGGSTGTDPVLVEHLIDLLFGRGFTNVVVGCAPPADARWLEHRDVMVLADLAGYRYVTDDDNLYDIVDCSEDLVPAAFPPESVLAASDLAEAWVDADLRIVFAKNKTDEENGFALALHTLLGVLPLRDKLYHYRARLQPSDLAVDLLRHTPVHVAVIDGVISNHGPAGSGVPNPIATATVIASPDLLLADFAGALKMGLDPYVAPANARALRAIGLPEKWDIVGSLEPYTGWQNVPPLLAHAVAKADDAPAIAGVHAALKIRPNTEVFPFTNVAVGKANRIASPAWRAIDQNPWMLAGSIWGHLALAAGVQWLDGWRTMYAKDQLRWRDVPLDLDPAEYSPADYESIAGYLDPLASLLRDFPHDADGMRWRLLDGSTLVEFVQDVSVPFDEFVQRVDISRAIQYLADYIGGRCVPIARDAQGRVTHQVERNIYLAQPNYVAFYGGPPIDVVKLEFVEYGPSARKIFWRTVKSSNGSASYDDGTVEFAAAGARSTRVTFFARQEFTLPPALEALHLELVPEIREPLLADAYSTFFERTLDNFMAAYRGEPFRIGRPWTTDAGEPGADPELGAVAAHAQRLGNRARELVTRAEEARRAGDGRRGFAARARGPQGVVDEDGFTHFTPRRATRRERDAGERGAQLVTARFVPPDAFGGVGEFLSDLSKAIGKDFGYVTDDA
jgi:uncharacterized protein (DUF362 family)